MKRMEGRHSTWLRCARFVARQYDKSNTPKLARDETSTIEIASRLETTKQRLKLTRSRGWKAAEAKVIEDYHRQLRKLREHIESELEDESCSIEFKINEVELFRDIQVLNEEFVSVSFDKKASQLSAVTKDIELESLQLGAFRIELHLDSLSKTSRAYYEVIAIDANRSSSNDDVTHPHVQDARLCEGDAQPAIRLALEQGRLLDFFQLVENVLGTYNPSSAYVTIRDWDGTTCGHCGHSSDPVDCRECAGCDEFVCDSCVYRCNDCEDAFCGNCDEPCSGCLESTCKSCIRICVECDERHCSDCLSENERCTSCEEKTKEDSKSGGAETAVHGKRLGETALPA